MYPRRLKAPGKQSFFLERVRDEDLRGLLRFKEEYPEAKVHLLHLGSRRWHDRGVEVVPLPECVAALDQWV